MKAVGVALGLVCLLGSAQAKVGTISLDYLAQISDVILIGEVQRVDVIAGVKIARIRAMHFVKGKAEGPIAFVAEPTWKCDISRAVSGERVLLYLKKARTFEGPMAYGQNLNAVQASLNQAGAKLYTLSYSGRGRIPLGLNKDRWVAPVTQGDKNGPVLNVNLYIPRSVNTFIASAGHRVVSLSELVARSEKAISKISKTTVK